MAYSVTQHITNYELEHARAYKLLILHAPIKATLRKTLNAERGI